MIKILRVVTRLNIGGPSKQIYTLNKYCEVEQFEQFIVTGRVGKNEKEVELDSFKNLIKIGSMRRNINPIFEIASIFELTRIIRLHKPQIIHTHLAKAWSLTTLAKLLSNSNALSIHTFHGHNIHSYFKKTKNISSIFVQRLMARNTDILVAVSSEVRDELLTNKIGDRSKFVVIEPGIESFDKIDKTTARSLLGMNPKMFTIGFIGRFKKVKRPDLLKQIIIALKGSQMEDSCQFLLCGGGSFYEQLREELEPLNVKFIGWTQDLAQIYSSLDLMILTSDNEGTPLSIIEAGMMGVPTLSRNVGGIPTLIEDNKTGFLCGETSEDFVKRIIELTLSENIIRKVSLNVEDLYRKKFSVQDFIRNYSHLYRNGKPNHL